MDVEAEKTVVVGRGTWDETTRDQIIVLRYRVT